MAIVYVVLECSKIDRTWVYQIAITQQEVRQVALGSAVQVDRHHVDMDLLRLQRRQRAERVRYYARCGLAPHQVPRSQQPARQRAFLQPTPARPAGLRLDSAAHQDVHDTLSLRTHDFRQ